jgi:hypothetical protein
MAIKGKGKTRTRQPVRAPRRGPVPVPVPFARRRGVQLVAAFVAGLLVFWGGIWLTNGLREQERTAGETEQALLRRRAGGAWQDLVETQVGTIGTVQPGSPPQVLPQVRAVIGGLADETPKDAVATLKKAGVDAKKAGDAIGRYDLPKTLTGKGFDRSGVLRFLSAKDELVTGIGLAREAALLGAIAADLDVGRGRTALIERAQALLTLADAAFARFQTHQIEALSSAGITPGLPGS